VSSGFFLHIETLELINDIKFFNRTLFKFKRKLININNRAMRALIPRGNWSAINMFTISH